ncbi:MAG: hypothetical protein KatS3mg077_3054 [Candidatus Binatia bacterium]|nr:MAG: hypothetical protein KatS3mg077_3054 [Candidatus Binatia bacterium]
MASRVGVSGMHVNPGDVRALAAGIIDTSRSLRVQWPLPKGSYFYGLDQDMPYEVSLLQALSSQGIFRKYEFVLEVESGFGGRARWAARQFGCRVLGVEPDKWRADIAWRLGAQSATLEEAVFVAGGLDALPFPSGAFTHVWWLWPRGDACHFRYVEEIHRVLRDGGYFAWVARDSAMAEHAGAFLREAGFVLSEVRPLEVAVAGPWRGLAERKLEQVLAGTPAVFSSWRRAMEPEAKARNLALLFARRAAKQLWR